MSKKTHFEEWDVEVKNTETGPVFEKLKCSRDRVLISEEHAEVLNNSNLHGGNRYVKMYFKADKKAADKPGKEAAKKVAAKEEVKE